MVYQFASGPKAKAYWRGLRVIMAKCPAWGLGPPSETTSRIFSVRFPGALAFQALSRVTRASRGTAAPKPTLIN